MTDTPRFKRTCPICSVEYDMDGSIEGEGRISTAFEKDPDHKRCNDCYRKGKGPKPTI